MAFCMVFICTVMCCICTCVGQNIILYGHQQDEKSMSCTKGLLIDYDAFFIKAEVNCTHDNAITTFFIRYKAKNHSDFTYLCDTDLKGSLHQTPYCLFNITSDGNCVYHIECALRTEPLLSEATLQGSVVAVNNNKVTSNEITLPKLYHARSSTGQLIVNGRAVQTDGLHDVTVTGRDLALVFVCYCEAAPCWIEILTDHSADVQRSELYALFTRTFDSPAEINVTIKYSACRMYRECNVLRRKIRIDLPLEVTEMARDGYSQATVIVLGVLIGVLALTVVILIGVCCHYKKKSTLSQRRSLSTGVSFESDQEPTDPRILALVSEMSGNENGETPKKTAKILTKRTKKMKSKPVYHMLIRPPTDGNSEPTNGQEDIQVNLNMNTSA